MVQARDGSRTWERKEKQTLSKMGHSRSFPAGILLTAQESYAGESSQPKE
jgi:hypothetical protein